MKFDATKVRKSTLTDGEYQAVIDDITDSENKKGTGRYFWVRLKVTQDNAEGAGSLLSMFINYEHQNQTAQELGLQLLSKLCYAVGILQFDNVEELIGSHLNVIVGSETINGVDRNVVTELLVKDNSEKPAEEKPKEEPKEEQQEQKEESTEDPKEDDLPW